MVKCKKQKKRSAEENKIWLLSKEVDTNVLIKINVPN